MCQISISDAGVFLMACGGDDSALTVYKITATCEKDLFQSVQVTEIATAHAAQITGTSHNRKSNNTRLGIGTGTQYTIPISCIEEIEYCIVSLIFEIDIK